MAEVTDFWYRNDHGHRQNVSDTRNAQIPFHYRKGQDVEKCEMEGNAGETEWRLKRFRLQSRETMLGGRDKKRKIDM